MCLEEGEKFRHLPQFGGSTHEKLSVPHQQRNTSHDFLSDRIKRIYSRGGYYRQYKIYIEINHCKQNKEFSCRMVEKYIRPEKSENEAPAESEFNCIPRIRLLHPVTRRAPCPEGPGC